MTEATTPEPQRNRAARRAEHRRLRKTGAALATLPAALGTTALLVGATAGTAGAADLVVTNLNATGGGSLHDVAEGAGDGDVITFQAGLTGTITLTEPINIDTSVTINGPGADVITVSGNDAVQIFDIDGPTNDPSIDVTITGLTLSQGASGGGGAIVALDANLTVTDAVLSDNSANGDGGAIRVADTDVDLRIERSELSGNTAASWGGAVYFYGRYSSVTITDSTLSGNSADSGGGAMWAGGYFGSVALVTGTTVSGNTAANNGGGGLAMYTKSTTVRSSVITGNSANGDGGGLYVGGNREVETVIEFTTVAGNTAVGSGGGVRVGFNREAVTIRNSTISGNSADADGGGIVTSTDAYGLVSVLNTTISGNTAGEEGGGIFHAGYYGLDITQSTITDNTATTVGGVYILGEPPEPKAASDGRGKDNRPAEVRTRAEAFLPVVSSGSIISGNSGIDVGRAGELQSASSLLGTVTGTAFTDQGGNLQGVSPLLGPLQDNGGPTETHALLAGSPAINAGPNPVATFPGNDNDQRGPGYARVSDGRADIGAFEVQVTTIEPNFTG